MRLIDADALQREYEKYHGGKRIVLVDLAPTIEERKKGKWLKGYGDHVACGVRPRYRFCSECNEVTAFQHNFCPNCGADMRGAEDTDMKKLRSEYEDEYEKRVTELFKIEQEAEDEDDRR